MDDERSGDPFDEPEGLDPQGFDAEPFAQDGPDLFGTEPDDLILPTEPVPVPDPDMDLPLDEMDEIPIDPDEDPLDDPDAAAPDAASAVPAPAPAVPPPSREAPLALYRRYRPETFAEVIGQEHVTEPLQRALVNNRVNHAYLFSGPRGCGKTTSARILARCLNCEQGPTPTPCGVCRSCRDLARGGAGSIDVIEIDAASHGGVNEARDLRERVFFAPVSSRYKIYIIDEAHMVTKEGFNALLKVVEEPPPHVKFIFATTEPEKVIGTIRSRTHHYPFRLVPPKTLAAYLATLCEAEGARVDKAVLPLVVRAGAGSVRDSLSVLDQLLGGSGPDGVTYAQAAALLGYTPDTLLDEIMDAFAAGDAAGVFACVDKVIEVGQDPRRFAEDLLRRLRDLIIVAAVPEALTTGLVDVSGDQAERLTTQASGMGTGELTRAAEVIARGLTEMRGTTAPRLHLELMCARVLLPGADVDDRGVHARLDRLERRLSLAADAGPPAAAAEPVATRAPERAEASRPAPAPVSAGAPATAPPASTPPPTPAPTPAPAPAGSREPGALTAADLRRVWPQVLEAVSRRRRVTWMVLRENAQVQGLADGTLTLALSNPGALESLQRGGSEDILRESILEVVGIAVRIQFVDETSAPPARARSRASGSRASEPRSPEPRAPEPRSPEPRAPAPRSPEPRPAAPAGPTPASSTPAPSTSAPSTSAPAKLGSERPRPAASDPEAHAHAERARRNIVPTRLGVPDEPPEEPDRDDPDVDEEPLGTDELLTRYLDAKLIGEEEPTP